MKYLLIVLLIFLGGCASLFVDYHCEDFDTPEYSRRAYLMCKAQESTARNNRGVGWMIQ